VIGAKEGNGIGIAGIAPGARMMALRACWQTGSGPTLCDSLSLAKALHFAVDRNAEVINLSLSGPPNRLLQRLIAIALARKLAVVAAFDPALPRGGFPASQPGVVAVGDQSMASLPPTVYLAPGNDVPTTEPGGKWNLVDGSSYAAAHVSGLIALVRQKGGRALVASRGSGGVVDACATLVATSPACDCNCAVARQTRAARR
jgi:subtilisin family serine protease